MEVENKEGPQKIADYDTGDSEELACPDCGVVQRVDWHMAEYKNNGSAKKVPYVDDVCAVCGYDDVWV